jgi:hypothetical protein
MEAEPADGILTARCNDRDFGQPDGSTIIKLPRPRLDMEGGARPQLAPSGLAEAGWRMSALRGEADLAQAMMLSLLCHRFGWSHGSFD